MTPLKPLLEGAGLLSIHVDDLQSIMLQLSCAPRHDDEDILPLVDLLRERKTPLANLTLVQGCCSTSAGWEHWSFWLFEDLVEEKRIRHLEFRP